MTRNHPHASLLAACLVLVSAGLARGQSPSPGGGGSTPPPAGTGSEGDPTQIPAAASRGWGRWYLPYYVVRATPDGRIIPTLHVPYGAVPPVIVVAPASRPTAPAPPPGLLAPVPVNARRIVGGADHARAERLTIQGDRLFRAGERKQAETRYERAARIDPFWATPRARLSQVALTRGRRGEAADLLREAETAEPGWIETADDLRSLYANPEDFDRTVAGLEAHLREEPRDRDALLLLGAQLHLSRGEEEAAKVFRRLDDPHRRPDVALAAFLRASRLREPEPKAPAPEPGRDPFAPPADEDAPRP